MRNRARPVLAAVSAFAGTVCAVLALAGPASAAPATVHGAALTSAATGSVVPATSAQVTGVHLTPVQVAALRSAIKVNPKLTAAQAAKLLGARSGARVAVPDGHGQSPGPCGNASLFGYSNGGYGLALFFNATVGPPVIGSVGISTNGIFASTDWYSVPPVRDSGRLSDTGAIPDATTADGWAVTSNAWYCGISVIAYW